VVLWQNFGKEILDFDQAMRMEGFGPTVHGHPPSWTERTVRHLCADGPRGPDSDTRAQ
jgi:hypothetical protein